MSKKRLVRWAVYVAVGGAVGIGVSIAGNAIAAEGPGASGVNETPAVVQPVDASPSADAGTPSQPSGEVSTEVIWD